MRYRYADDTIVVLTQKNSAAKSTASKIIRYRLYRVHRPRRQVRVVAAAGEQPALGNGHAVVIERAPDLPPLAQQRGQFRRQHHVPILAALALPDADNAERPIDMLHLEPRDIDSVDILPRIGWTVSLGLFAMTP